MTAEVVINDDGLQKVIPVEDAGRAWCLVAPPDFAPEITSVVTLYDLLVDMAARKLDLPDEGVYGAALRWLKELHDELRNGASALTSYRPDYVRDVFPLQERALQFRWVHERAANAHALRSDGCKPHQVSVGRHAARTGAVGRHGREPDERHQKAGERSCEPSAKNRLPIPRFSYLFSTDILTIGNMAP